MELVCVFCSFDPDEEGHRAAGAFVVNRRVGDTNHHHIVLPDPGAGHGRLHHDVEQDVSYTDQK